MANAPLPFGIERTLLRLDSKDPYLCLHFVIIFVRDQELSLRFFADKLEFRVIVDHKFEDGRRWIEVAPPDGTAQIGISLPVPGTDPEKIIGGETSIYFLTEDIHEKYKTWSDRGVHFQYPPEVPSWGGLHTRFEDPDGNSFGLVGFDEVTRGVEEHRRALARKYEAERRAAQEMEIAKQVQARLFPQIHPEPKTLEYAGLCLQTREVGGDYFDFLDLGQHHLGLVIGDVSGKGIAAALLMANLQANLRSQSTLALSQPELFLSSVNRLFFENTSDSAFASLFFATYDDASQLLRYANCGHLSGLVLRADNTCVRLESTGTLLGLFQEWDCSMGECQLSPGDTLALYTDGITEAYNDAGEEFGEQSLIDRLREYRHEPCQSAVEAITSDVRRFNSREQHDDITLILAKCRESS